MRLLRLLDVNVLINAHRAQQPHHGAARAWLEETLHAGEAFEMSQLVLSGFLRVVTMRSRFLTEPTPLAEALAFVDVIRTRRHHVPIRPGPRHFGLFADLLRQTAARGKLVPDAYLAALAIEHGCMWASFDRDFARFPGLAWSVPGEGLTEPRAPRRPSTLLRGDPLTERILASSIGFGRSR